MKELSLARFVKYGLYAVAFVPLIIFKDFISPFHFGKVVVFRSLIEILFAFYLILIWRNKTYLPKRSPIFWALLLFTAVFGLTTLLSIQVYESFWGTLERMGGFWTFLHYFAYFAMLSGLFRNAKDWLKWFDIAIFVGLLSALYGFGQKTDIEFFIGSGNRARIFGTIGNAALFSGYELFIVFLSLAFYFRQGNSFNRKLFYGAIFLLSSLSILMTAVRGSVFGLFLGLFIFILLYVWKYESRRAKNLLLGFVVLIVVFIVFSLLFKDSQFVKNSSYLTRLTDLSIKSYTVQTRLWAWEAGLKGWQDSVKTMIFGWGPENFNIPFAKYFNPNFYTGPGAETFFDRAHNMFIEVLVTMGIVGLLAYLHIFVSAFRTLWLKLKNTSPEQGSIYYVSIFALLSAYMVHNFFFFDTSANFILFFTLLGFISFSGSSGLPTLEVKTSLTSSVKKSQLQGPVLIVFLILVAWLIYQTNIKPAKANYTVTRGIVRGWNNDVDGAVKKFQEAMGYDTFGIYEYRHRYAQYLFDNSGKIKNKKEVVLSAIEEVKKNTKTHPADYLPLLYLSRLNILLGQGDTTSEYNDIALRYANQALEVSPTFVRTYFEIGQVYINKNDYKKAAEAFKKAAELQPDVGIAFWYWSVVEADMGNLALAEELLKKALTAEYRFAPTESDALRMVNLYVKTSNHEGLRIAFERLTRTAPNNPQYHASLASVYVKLGNLDGAVAEAKKAAELDPSFEGEARAFVKALGRDW